MSIPGDLGWFANGNIKPCRFVSIDTSGDGLVVEPTGGVTTVVYGISAEVTHNPPISIGGTNLDDGYAAVAGEPIKVYKVGEVCLLETSAAVTRGARLGPSAGDGRGVTAAAPNPAGAIALQSSSGAGKKIYVLVIHDEEGTS